MRVAVVHSFYAGQSPSGENSAVNDQVEALRAAGHTVELFSRQSTDADESLSRKVRSAARIATGHGVTPRRGLRAFGPDVVHVHNLHPNWGAQWIDEFADRTVATLHNYRPVCSAATLFREGADCTECLDLGSGRALVHRCYRGSLMATAPLALASRARGSRHPMMSRLRHAVVLNPEAEALWHRLFPGLSIDLVPNFVSEVPVTAAPRRGWLFAGRLTEEKGLSWLLENWPAGRRLVVAGAGPLEADVLARAQREPDVDFVGRLGREELRRLIGEVHGLLVPSLWSEGLPTVALEALAAGTPVLAGRRAVGLAELVAAQAGRWLDTEPGSASLDAALADVEADGEGYSTRATALHQLRYSAGAWVRQIEGVYAAMTGAPTGVPS